MGQVLQMENATQVHLKAPIHDSPRSLNFNNKRF